MENIEKNEIITTEAIEEITDATNNNGNVLKTIGIIGVGLAGAALLTKFVLLPLGKKVVTGIQMKKARRDAEKNPEVVETELSDMDLDEIPDIE